MVQVSQRGIPGTVEIIKSVFEGMESEVGHGATVYVVDIRPSE